MANVRPIEEKYRSDMPAVMIVSGEAPERNHAILAIFPVFSMMAGR